MDIHSRIMASFVEWIAAANTNGNLFSVANGVQNQALPLTAYANNIQQNNPTENGNNSGKTLSIRCIVESIPNAQCWSTTYANVTNGHIEVDRKANVPIHTVFQNLIEVVLRNFGYPKETAVTAKGSIWIDNWRPIRFEKVAINPQKTVDEILGQINSFVTLRIQILKTASWPNSVISRIKEKLFQLLLLENSDRILSSGCPLDQVTLKNILQGSDYSISTPSDDLIRKFEQWVTNQIRQSVRPIPYPGSLNQFSYHLGSPTAIHYENNLNSGNGEDRVHPALQTIQSQYPTQKTRMRTSFDPELELPKLHKWFSENQHPNRQQIQQYVNELNDLESRRGRKPLDINNVIYWFKNARAAQKRAEVRSTNSGQLNSLNGYRSNSHSPCDTAVTSKESLGSAQSCDEDDIEDDENRSEGDEKEDSLDARPSNSPVAPLSLTTHKDNSVSRNSSPVQEIKQEPPDKIEPQLLLSNHNSEDKKNNIKSSPLNHHEFESEDEDIDEDGSDMESVHKNNCETEIRNSLFSNSSPLSIIPRSASNPVFPLVPNSMFNPNFTMFGMSHYMTNIGINANRNAIHGSSSPNANNISSSPDERRNKRNRTFIDPVTEVPCLEKWFCMNTHPTHGLIVQYTENLNSMPYRKKFPKLEPKNVQFWFKNRRAKCKRLKSSLYENIPLNNNLTTQDRFHQLAAALSNENYRNQE